MGRHIEVGELCRGCHRELCTRAQREPGMALHRARGLCTRCYEREYTGRGVARLRTPLRAMPTDTWPARA